MRAAPIKPLANDCRGVTVVEFGIVAPVLALLLLGGFDTAHSLYMRAALQGIVQKTARDSALESGTDSAQQTVLDNKVRTQVLTLANNATIAITRRYYRTFSDASAARAENYSDTDHDGQCDNGEPYDDENQNGTWDADGGNAGQGGAKDRTVYTVAVSYPRFFPLYRLIGGSNVTKISAATVLSNQPYSDQGSYSTTIPVRNCT